MQDKTPYDDQRYDASGLGPQEDFSEEEYSDDEGYEERSYTFEEAYAAAEPSPTSTPARRRSASPDRKRSKAAKASNGSKAWKPDKLTKEDKALLKESKKRLSRKEKKALVAQARDEAVMMTETPVVGKKLRPGQMLVYDSELDEVDYTDPKDLPEVRDYLPIRFRRYGRVGLGGGIMYALFVICVSIVLACFGWMCAVDVLALNKEAATGIVVIDPYSPAPGEPTTVKQENSDGEEVEVPIKVDIDQVADALKNSGVIEYKWLFKLFAMFSNANIKIDPGTYSLDTSLDYRALVTNMQYGSAKQDKVKVTFPEGYSVDQIFTLLENNQVCSKSDLYNAVETYEFHYDFLEGLPMGDKERLEGYLFPDTYEFFAGEPAVQAISRFLDNLENRLEKANAAELAASRGLSLHEMLTMASLVEKEAGGAEGERQNVASALYNRLNAGWKLQLDSTVNYIKGTSTFDLTYDDLEIDSPYNTYMYEGLPPGPICNPGMAAINAVLNPASTNYWFWYSVDGVSTFFESADAFNAFASSH